ncbi:Auxin-responsive protein [Psidium guajava]|nr:Auxin-responsive protein [Psidium guajava]
MHSQRTRNIWSVRRKSIIKIVLVPVLAILHQIQAHAQSRSQSPPSNSGLLRFLHLHLLRKSVSSSLKKGALVHGLVTHQPLRAITGIRSLRLQDRTVLSIRQGQLRSSRYLGTEVCLRLKSRASLGDTPGCLSRAQGFC